MWETLYLPGTTIETWPGVVVVENDGTGRFRPINWAWSWTPHQHYQVATFDTGSYWVPVSTRPPAWWRQPVSVVGVPSVPYHSVNPYGNEYRPSGIYIWIPHVPQPYEPGETANRVDCTPPTSPPLLMGGVATNGSLGAATGSGLAHAEAQLDALLALPSPLAADPAGTFKDSDGLISFVNLSTDLVKNNVEFKTGTAVFDKIANFFSTLRIKVFTSMKSGHTKPLQGDPMPDSQWDPAVTHFMQFLLQETGGLTDYSITDETYSETQILAEFSTGFIKLLFDAAVVPSGIIEGVMSFISGVGKSLQASWDKKKRTYAVALLGQCHEAVQENSTGDPIYRYFPKLKYYHLVVDATQEEFKSDCATVRKITFNFKYEYYVTAVAAAVLDKDSGEYTKFTGFLDKAQAANYKDAENKLDGILDGTVSTGPSKLSTFNVDLATYPKVLVTPSRRLVPA